MAIDNLDGLQLGSDVEYGDQYCADLLFPISRALTREALGIVGAVPFNGEDVWNAYELSWLNNKGLPQVACASFRFPCDSVSIIESKSFKLYLNSFNQSVFASWEQILQTLEKDLSDRCGAPVDVSLVPPSSWDCQIRSMPQGGILLDEQDVTINDYQPNPHLLSTFSDKYVEEMLVSHLLRSLCPVTGQPDWASVFISYKGAAFDRVGLLKYIVGFRQHQEFHEQCIERMFLDILTVCKPVELTVYARYVRRGGLDINPFRSTGIEKMDNWRLYRQ